MTANGSNTRPREPRDHRPIVGGIRQGLADRKMSKLELCDKTGYGDFTVSQALRGEPMTWTFLNEVATVLGVRFDAVGEPIRDCPHCGKPVT